MGKEVARPLIIKEDEYDSLKIHALVESKKPHTIDLYNEQIKELAEITFPSSSQNEERDAFVVQRTKSAKAGTWIYYPWSNTLMHIVNENEYQRLLTNRNKLLITDDEQRELQDSTAAIFGLSVGNGIAIALAHSGIARRIYIADYDTFSTTNMNRVNVGLDDMGQTKLDVTTRQLYEINPFLEITGLDKGVTPENLEHITSQKGTLLFYDEIDDFRMKVHLRVVAKERHIPVIMLSSLGDYLLVDVERYDTEPETQIFNGKISQDVTDAIINKQEFTEQDIKKFAAQVVGVEHVPTRALNSLIEIGSTLVGRPQLYSTVSLDGGVASYLTRQVVLKKGLKSGRYLFSLADIFHIRTNDLSDDEERKQILKKLGISR